MLRALGKVSAQVEPLVPFSEAVMRVSHLYSRQAQHLIGRYEPAHLNPFVVRASRARLRALVSPSDLDAVIGVAASTLVSAIPERMPAIYLSDATFRLLRNYYPKFSGMPDGIAARADQFEREAIGRADALIFSSQWAADSAVADYGADPGKITVVPFGASLPAIPAPQARSLTGERLRLLFIGVKPYRKGAAITVAAAQSLQQRGFNASLTIVGCTPPEDVELPSWVTNVPYLSKRDPNDFRTPDRLFRDADLFILPTQAECTPIVFCEAAAYGLPILATDTGGVGSVVQDSVTGALLPELADGEDYANRICELVADEQQYRQMTAASRNDFETRLNWNSWAENVMDVAKRLV